MSDGVNSVKEEEKKTTKYAFKEKTDAFISNMKIMFKEKDKRDSERLSEIFFIWTCEI